MARYPKAIWRPIAKKQRYAMRSPVRMNLHVAVSEASSLRGFFNRGGNPDSHFYVRRDGTVEQYVDTSQIAYCDLQGNPDTISVETQGGLRNAQTEEWTPEQVVALAELYAWAVETHGIARKMATDSRKGSSSHGLSWHRLGIDGNFPSGLLAGRVSGGLKYSNHRGKVCPGNAKIRQIEGIFDRAMQLLGAEAPAKKPVSNTKPAPRPKPAAKKKYVPAIDGVFGPVTKGAFQQALHDARFREHSVDTVFGRYSVLSMQKWLRKRGQKGHAIDGVWGKYTTIALQKHLRRLGEKGHTIDGDFGPHTIKSLQRALRKGLIK